MVLCKGRNEEQEIVACGMETGCRGSRRGLDRLGALEAVQCEGDGVRCVAAWREWSAPGEGQGREAVACGERGLEVLESIRSV